MREQEVVALLEFYELKAASQLEPLVTGHVLAA
jgi:hypothetical protein